jgi:lysophospholipase L1-like esterase
MLSASFLRLFVSVSVLLVALAAGGPNGASGATAGVPNSMASLGDSITRAFDADTSSFGDQPQNSWATGTSSFVESHYFRILQSNAAISGNAHNLAVSGARMTNLNGQAANVNAIAGGVDYVTILMGANDVCTSSEATMTAVETFRSQFVAAMDTLTTGTPGARIFVISIPDVYNLWDILHTNNSATFTWGLFSICQSLLARPTSTDQADVDRRARVRQRNIDDNTQLAEVCALYAQCTFDNNAIFNDVFTPADVSTLDYFHPSLSGQQRLAWGSWQLFDMDADGWITGAEEYIGTDALNPCTAGGWPPDAQPAPGGNGIVQIDDVAFAAGTFGSASTPRAEIANQNGIVQIDDIAEFAGRFGKSCG